jgi:hypothetical protein
MGLIDDRFTDVCLPALPILNLARHQHLLDTVQPNSPQYPSAINLALIAHSVIYDPAMRPLHVPLFSELYEIIMVSYRETSSLF